MLRIIGEVFPEWVVAENVRGILTIDNGMVFERVCLDLEAAGYEVQTFIIPAIAVGAPHRRDRVWIIGNSKSTGQPSGIERQRKKEHGRTSERVFEKNPAHNTNGDVHGRNGRNGEHEILSGKRREYAQHDIGEVIENTHGIGSDRRLENNGQVLERRSPEAENAGSSWSRNWTEVAAELCGVDDGIYAELDGFKLSKSKHREAQLKGYGNAIVPHIAYEIFKSIDATVKSRSNE